MAEHRFTADEMNAKTFTKGEQDHTTLSFVDEGGAKVLVQVPNDVFEDAMESKVQDIIDAKLDETREAFQGLREDVSEHSVAIKDLMTGFLDDEIKNRFGIKRPVSTGDSDAEKEAEENEDPSSASADTESDGSDDEPSSEAEEDDTPDEEGEVVTPDAL